MKLCNKCKIEKPLNAFGVRRASKDGLQYKCKECRRSEYSESPEAHKRAVKRYNKNNPEKVAKRLALWKEKNPDYSKQYIKLWRKEHPEYQREYERKKYRTDINWKLARRLRIRISDLVRGKIKAGSAVRDLGCSKEELKKYLEKQFVYGMNWNNYGCGWEIDHIIPLSSFDLEDREQFLKACHYTNLQPLWGADNLSKGAKVG